MMILTNPILLNAFLAVFLLAFLTAPMGCLTVWRRLSYFGATLSHASLLGIILGLVLGIDLSISLLVFTLLLALFLGYALQHTHIANDTLLGMTAHLSLAIAIVAVAYMKNLRLDLMSYLVGNILAVSTWHLWSLALLVVVGVLVIIRFWPSFVLITLSKEIAQSEGHRVRLSEMVLTLLLALTISLGIQIIGILLMVSLLIIPAASARLLAHSSFSMVVWAFVLTVTAGGLGLSAAYYWDLPAGASIVCLMGVLFVGLKIGLRR